MSNTSQKPEENKVIDFKIPCIVKLEHLIKYYPELDIRIRPLMIERILESQRGNNSRKNDLKIVNGASSTEVDQHRSVRFREDKNYYHEDVGQRCKRRGKGFKQSSDIKQTKVSLSHRQTKIKLPASKNHRDITSRPNNDGDSDDSFVDKPGTIGSKQSVKTNHKDNWRFEREARLSSIATMVGMSISEKREIKRVSRRALYTPEEVAEQLGAEWEKPEDLCRPFKLVIVKSDEIKSLS